MINAVFTFASTKLTKLPLERLLTSPTEVSPASSRDRSLTSSLKTSSASCPDVSSPSPPIESSSLLFRESSILSTEDLSKGAGSEHLEDEDVKKCSCKRVVTREKIFWDQVKTVQSREIVKQYLKAIVTCVINRKVDEAALHEASL